MYCKICGNLLNDGDSVCRACGSEIFPEPVETPEPLKEQEAPDVIFNPPYSEFKRDRDSEQTAQLKREGRIGKPDTGEFSWDVYDFPDTTKPTSKKTETARFDWSNEDEQAMRAKEAAEAKERKADVNMPEAAELVESEIHGEPTAGIESMAIDKMSSLEDEAYYEEARLNAGAPSHAIDFAEDSSFVKKIDLTERIKQEEALLASRETRVWDPILLRDSKIDTDASAPGSVSKNDLDTGANLSQSDSIVSDARTQNENYQSFDPSRYAPKEDKLVELQEDGPDGIITKSDLEKATFAEFQQKGIDTGLAASNDKFFTFSKKNEEFQRLLDKEYARINGLEDPTPIESKSVSTHAGTAADALEKQTPMASTSFMEQTSMPTSPFVETVPEVSLAPEIPFVAEGPKMAVPSGIHDYTKMQKQRSNEDNAPQRQNDSAVRQPQSVDDSAKAANSVNGSPYHERANASVSEMEAARKSFFADSVDEEIVLDNESIKQRYDTLEVLRNDLKGKKDNESEPQAGDGRFSMPDQRVSTEKQGSVREERRMPSGIHENTTASEGRDNDFPPFEAGKTGINQESTAYWETEEEESQKGGLAAKIVLVVIVLLLVAELTILGIKSFTPDSQATAFILEKEIAIVETVSNWISNIKGLFS